MTLHLCGLPSQNSYDQLNHEEKIRQSLSQGNSIKYLTKFVKVISNKESMRPCHSGEDKYNVISGTESQNRKKNE
jgi:hypothetical protein